MGADHMEDLEVPEWGRIRIRQLTERDESAIRRLAELLHAQRYRSHVIGAAIEREPFRRGVVMPSFSKTQVEKLQRLSGTGFRRVVDRLDELGYDA